jgi:hypothetical protein
MMKNIQQRHFKKDEEEEVQVKGEEILEINAGGDYGNIRLSLLLNRIWKICL